MIEFEDSTPALAQVDFKQVNCPEDECGSLKIRLLGIENNIATAHLYLICESCGTLFNWTSEKATTLILSKLRKERKQKDD